MFHSGCHLRSAPGSAKQCSCSGHRRDRHPTETQSCTKMLPHARESLHAQGCICRHTFCVAQLLGSRFAHAVTVWVRLVPLQQTVCGQIRSNPAKFPQNLTKNSQNTSFRTKQGCSGTNLGLARERQIVDQKAVKRRKGERFRTARKRPANGPQTV